ncbi:MAG TPA: sulfotransferase [Woeseiaceae bacterium]
MAPSAVSRTPQALARIEALLASDPALAEREAGLLLAADPGNAMARLFQGIARRLLGQPAAAIEVLEPLTQSAPQAPLPHLQLGLALREAGRKEAAAEAIRRAVAVKPDFADGWLALADLLVSMDDRQGADRAFGRYIEHSANDPGLREIAQALSENRTADAEAALRAHLQQHPTDVRATAMLAEVALRHGHYEAAERLLASCLELAPSYRQARHNYAVVLMRREKPNAALAEIDRLLIGEPDGAELKNLKAATLQRMGEYARAVEVYEDILARRPAEQNVWASLGHALRTLGRMDEAVRAYRKATTLKPDFGEAWWNLANLKTYRFSDADLEAMRAQLARAELGSDDRLGFHFALGKALEDQGRYEESFRQYAEGNRLRREKIQYDPGELSAYVAQAKALFTPDFFAARAGWGDPSDAPVFVVGLPRSGSTLVEQILASHSAVEGTMELTHIADIVRSLAEAPRGGKDYPDVLADLDASRARELGAAYLERASVQRKAGAPRFIDKTPANFLHIPLIALILPNARIVDVRRRPMACGFSIFKHLFAHGQPFAYRLEDIAAHYRDYVDLMGHFDAVLPGRVHRMAYESLVTDTETAIRRLLEFCGLPFEEACLRFFENPRAVSTPSSEQVRRPIFSEALEHWRHYAPWLDPLARELERAGLHEPH